jgi:hypothetical protein
MVKEIPTKLILFKRTKMDRAGTGHIKSCQPKDSQSVPSADNTQTGSNPYHHLFGTYDIAYAQFHQDPGLPEDGAPAAPKHVEARLIF